MSPETHDLPVIIAGRRYEPNADAVEIDYDGRARVRLYRPTDHDAEEMIATDGAELRELSFDDLTVFFSKVGDAWMSDDNPWRRLAISLGSTVTGYAESTMRSDADYLGHNLERALQYDFVGTDLGDVHLLDEWRPSRAVYMRCLPKGIIAHIMVGNVPLASLFTLYRSLATKNVTIAKLSSRDVVSALCFANCIYDTDPDHPVTRALSALYWEPGSSVEARVVAACDVLSVWGRGETIEAVKKQLPPGAEFIEFGPRRSLALVLDGAGATEEVGVKLGFDTIMYDQEACFSPQDVFVETDARAVAESLSDALARYETAVPRRQLTVDQEAHIQRARAEAELEGWEVIAPEGTEWTVVVTDGPVRTVEHPLARFVYVHPITSVDEVLAHTDRDVQTVSVLPWSRVFEIADPFTAAGADRVVPIGQMTRFRAGLTHDGFHPMRRMVRWVCIERSVAFKYNFGEMSVEEHDRRLYGAAMTDGTAAGNGASDRALEPAVSGVGKADRA